MGRPIWKGAINFGLVSIAVQLETAVREKTVRFHMLTKDGSCRLRQKLVCPDSGKEYDFSETARGVEVSPGQYVLIDKKEIDKIKPQRGRTIDIQQFVEAQDIDPVYFDAVYLVVPTAESAKAYRLFVDALKETNRVGLAQIVMRDRQHLAALRVMDHGLVMHTLHYVDEVLSLEDALPKAAVHGATSAQELQFARQLVEQMTQPANLKRFKDDYREELESMIEQKKRGKKIVETADDEETETAPSSMNLMEALKRSLEKPRKTPAAHHAARRKSA